MDFKWDFKWDYNLLGWVTGKKIMENWILIHYNPLNGIYPLVICYIAMENHHFLWIIQL